MINLWIEMMCFSLYFISGYVLISFSMDDLSTFQFFSMFFPFFSHLFCVRHWKDGWRFSIDLRGGAPSRQAGNAWGGCASGLFWQPISEIGNFIQISDFWQPNIIGNCNRIDFWCLKWFPEPKKKRPRPLVPECEPQVVGLDTVNNSWLKKAFRS